MKISYDKKNDTKYVSIRKGKVVSTKPHFEWLLFDFDIKGEILGVEILNASKNLISLVTDGKKLVSYNYINTSELSSKFFVSNQEHPSVLSVPLQYV